MKRKDFKTVTLSIICRKDFADGEAHKLLNISSNHGLFSLGTSVRKPDNYEWNEFTSQIAFLKYGERAIRNMY